MFAVLSFVVLSWTGTAQEIPIPAEELDKALNNANTLFEQVWPPALAIMKKQMKTAFGNMDEGDMVRKLRVEELKLDTPPSLVKIACGGSPYCRRIRFRLPGDGTWSVRIAGEIIPPWQRNQQKWRKLRLTLKDLSMTQDYDVVASADGSVRLEPFGPPKLTYRLTSPNLLYRAILSTAQKFIGDSLQESLAEDIMADLPIAQMALVDLGGLDLKHMVTDLGERVRPEAFAIDHSRDTNWRDFDSGGEVTWAPLDGPPEWPTEPVATVDDDAFSVAFLDRELDFYAPSFTAEVAVATPPGTHIEEVTFKLGTREVARLTAPPWRVEVFPDENSQVLLATATLTDGIQEDDYLYIEGRGYIEEMEVQYVKLNLSFPTKAFDDAQLRRLKPDAFRVREEGVTQQIADMSVALDRPLSLVVVMDMSASMEGERLQRARPAAHKFVDRLIRPGDSMRLVAYNDRIKTSELLTDKGAMLETIDHLNQTRGGTHTYDAVWHALDLQDDQADRLHVVLLMTDGFNSGGKVTLPQLMSRLHGQDVLLYTAGIGVNRRDWKGGGESLTPSVRPTFVHLQDLYDFAQATGARTFFVDDAGRLGRAFGDIEEELRSQLSLGYYSSNHSKGWRQIEVDYLPQSIPIRHKDRYWKE